MSVDVDSLPSVLQLHPGADHVYVAPGLADGDDVERNVVFGGQILSQAIIAAHLDRSAAAPNVKDVKSIHAIFARAGDYSQPISYEVERMHDGRALGSDTVTFSQGGHTMARALILWSIDEPDLIRHTEFVTMPTVAGPEDPAGRVEWRVFPGAEGLVVNGVNPASPDEPLRPPALNAWTRYGENFGPVVNQAMLAWATDGFLIGTAMLPHEGIDESIAHRTISTGVVSHTVNFHERFRADEWLLLAHEGIWAGRGRSHGRCNVWTADGRLVATYTQDALIRAFGDRQDHTADAARIM